MTIKELITKINTYNEIAEVLGNRKQALQINDYLFDCTCRMWHYETADYKQMKKALEDNYIEEFAQRLLKYEYFEFDKDVRLGNTIIEIRIVEM